MTLNEIIQWAKDNNVDFDALVYVPRGGAVDIKSLSADPRLQTGLFAELVKGLTIHIF